MQIYGEWRCVVSPTYPGLAFDKCVHYNFPLSTQLWLFEEAYVCLQKCKNELLKYTFKRNRTQTSFSHKD